jgi:hypothetical protein
MSQLFVDNIKNRTGGAIGAPSGAVVTGVVTATTFKGNVIGDVTGTAGGLTGTPDIAVRNITGVAATFTGVLTYEDVTNIDSLGIITARQGIRVGAGQSIGSDGAAVVYYGDGSNLGGVVSGVETKEGGTSKGTSQVSLNFTGATVTSAGTETTVAIAAAGISTTKYSPTANAIINIGLSTAQHHDLTLTAGITTITCSGGVFGESHSLVLTQPSSGIATVGFSTFFLFPSGATPSMSEGSSKVDLVSFVVKRVGAGGTQLLASAGLNYSN